MSEITTTAGIAEYLGRSTDWVSKQLQDGNPTGIPIYKKGGTEGMHAGLLISESRALDRYMIKCFRQKLMKGKVDAMQTYKQYQNKYQKNYQKERRKDHPKINIRYRPQTKEWVERTAKKNNLSQSGLLKLLLDHYKEGMHKDIYVPHFEIGETVRSEVIVTPELRDWIKSHYESVGMFMEIMVYKYRTYGMPEGTIDEG